MIKNINDEIDKFLLSLPNAENIDIAKIKDKYSSVITDSLDKGHITTNVCMIAASEFKTSPKELAQKLVDALEATGKFLSVESAGPGFVNITLQRYDFVSTIDKINKKKH